MIWGSLLWYFVLDSFYNYVIGGPYVGSLAKAITETTFWLTTLLCVTMLIAPLLAWRFYNFDCHPSLADKIRFMQKQSKQLKTRPILARTASARRSRRSLRSSYAFAHEVRCTLNFKEILMMVLKHLIGGVRTIDYLWKDYANNTRFCISSWPWQ